MSLNKAIQYRKEFRKPYKGSEVIDFSCRHHGDCCWCKRRRLYRDIRERKWAEMQIKEYWKKYKEFFEVND